MTRRSTSYTSSTGSAPPPYSPYENPTTGSVPQYQSLPNSHWQDPSSINSNERTPLNPRHNTTTRLTSSTVSYSYVGIRTQDRTDAATWIYRMIIVLLLATIFVQAQHKHHRKHDTIPTLPDSKERDSIRREWDRQRREHEAEMTQLKRERELWEVDWEREKNERKKDPIGEGRKLGLNWESAHGGRCVAFGKREYVARLDFEPSEACAALPLDINGRVVEGSQICEERGWDDDVVAHWYVDGERGCMPQWGRVYNKGCVAPGLHRWEARLWGLHNGEDWHAMCMTTPGDIGGRWYPAPTYCQNRGIFFGMVGMFHGVDPNCP